MRVSTTSSLKNLFLSPESTLGAFLIVLFLVMFFTWKNQRQIRRSRPRSKYLNEYGYVVLANFDNELEHRHIAKHVLGRRLRSDEVVHHINGRRNVNQVWNLCVMNREKHEHFHSWLRWKKEKSGGYPPIKEQKRILVQEYGGILLGNYKQPFGARLA